MEVFVDLSSDIGGLANVLSSIRNLKKRETENQHVDHSSVRWCCCIQWSFC